MWPFSPAVEEQAARADAGGMARDILADDSEHRRKRRWTRLLIVYLRALALLCLVRSLMDWSLILGFIGEPDQFVQTGMAAQATIVLLAVLSAVAAVGLWLTSGWGAVLWLIVTLCEVFLPMAVAQGLRAPGVAEYILLALAGVYVLLTWLSSRERDR
jgi:fatty acid desaturase